jgi:hypothetical protein
VHNLWLIVLDIDSWWGVLSTLHTLDGTSLMQMDQFIGTCKILMSFIGRKQRGFSDMSRGLPTLLYTMKKYLRYCWLHKIRLGRR